MPDIDTEALAKNSHWTKSEESEEPKKKFSDYTLKVNGVISIPNPLKNSHDYTLAGIVAITNADEEDQHDGSYAINYKGKWTGEIILQNEKKQQIKSKGKEKTQSQKLRGQIINSIKSDTMSGDEWYDYIMPKLRHWWPEVQEWLLKQDS